MMPARNTNQLGLFGTAAITTAPASTRDAPPPRGRSKSGGTATPVVARDVLAEVQAGRFGLLDDSDRVVVIDGDGHVRAALDADVVHELIRGRYVQPCAARDSISALHGAVRKPVSLLRLSTAGRELLHRWSALHDYT